MISHEANAIILTFTDTKTTTTAEDSYVSMTKVRFKCVYAPAPKPPPYPEWFSEFEIQGTATTKNYMSWHYCFCFPTEETEVQKDYISQSCLQSSNVKSRDSNSDLQLFSSDLSLPGL